MTGTFATIYAISFHHANVSLHRNISLHIVGITAQSGHFPPQKGIVEADYRRNRRSHFSAAFKGFSVELIVTPSILSSSPHCPLQTCIFRCITHLSTSIASLANPRVNVKPIMKLIITGATGFVGTEIVRQSLKNPNITSVVALARRPFSIPSDLEQGANPSKLQSVTVKDYDTYPEEVRKYFAGADACIW